MVLFLLKQGPEDKLVLQGQSASMGGGIIIHTLNMKFSLSRWNLHFFPNGVYRKRVTVYNIPAPVKSNGSNFGSTARHGPF